MANKKTQNEKPFYVFSPYMQVAPTVHCLGGGGGYPTTLSSDYLFSRIQNPSPKLLKLVVCKQMIFRIHSLGKMHAIP